MAVRVARKRLHYVRAVYNQGTHPQKRFHALVRQALHSLKHAADTEIQLPRVGTLLVRHRRLSGSDHLLLAIGVGEPNERMSTLGLNVARPDDTDQSLPPPSQRAFKLADAFCLLCEDDLVVCLDGMRLAVLGRYLSELLQKVNLDASAAAFELAPIADATQQEVLDREGIKKINIRSALYAATVDADAESAGGWWHRTLDGLRDVFLTDMPDPKDRDVLAEHWGELCVETSISAKGGTRAEEIVLDSMDAVGRDLLDDAGSTVRVRVVTQSDTSIEAEKLVLGKYVNFTRASNDLNHADVWDALKEYEMELRSDGYWQS